MHEVGIDINQAIQYLELGQLVAIPTETVYGLAANAFDSNAVLSIYKAKNRPEFNPLIIHTDSIAKLESWGLIIPEKMKVLAAHFSPGPITFVIPKSNHIPDVVTAGTDAVAVRIPQHPLTLALLSQLNFPLAAPSANPSGYVSPTKASHVYDQLGQKVSYILDGGDCSIGLESTIISFLNTVPTILRYGGLAVESIEAIIGEVKHPKEGYIDNPIAPGQLIRHYATRFPLVVGDLLKLKQQYALERIGVLAFKDYDVDIPKNHQLVLSPSGNLDEAAAHLFAAMRLLDKMDIDIITAEQFPNTGLGRAINDRLKRASEPA